MIERDYLEHVLTSGMTERDYLEHVLTSGMVERDYLERVLTSGVIERGYLERFLTSGVIERGYFECFLTSGVIERNTVDEDDERKTVDGVTKSRRSMETVEAVLSLCSEGTTAFPLLLFLDATDSFWPPLRNNFTALSSLFSLFLIMHCLLGCSDCQLVLVHIIMSHGLTISIPIPIISKIALIVYLLSL